MPNTIPAAGEAMPTSYRTPQVLIDFNRRTLEQLSMHDLNIMYDGITAARDAVNGVECQPRCKGAAHSAMAAIQDCLMDAIEMVEAVAQSAKPTDKTEADIRAYLIMKHASNYHDDFSCLEETFVTLSAEMVPFREGTAE